MTHEEQISLFEALALNGAWSNAACTGYCLLAMQRAGLDEKTIEKVLHVQEISSLSMTADGRALGVEFSGVLYNGETIRVEVNTGG